MIGDRLGVASGQGILLQDVTGDGTLDIVAGSESRDEPSIPFGPSGVDKGAIYVWAGGPGLDGDLDPTAKLAVPTAVAGDMLGGTGITPTQGIQCYEVTGDGTLDIVAAAPLADEGAVDTGALYVFAGGALSGDVAPTATLVVPGAVGGELLGSGQSGFRCSDVTGDGQVDIVAPAPGEMEGGTALAGAIYLWGGGASLTGTPAPTARMTASNPTVSDLLGYGLACHDVTGDGTPDVVAPTINADIGAVQNAGAVYVYVGGAGLTGSVTETAMLTVPGAAWFDQLGNLGAWFGDVTGDGTDDVLSGTFIADVGGVTNTGALYAWAGGGGLTGNLAPTATLTVPGASINDYLGNSGVSLRDLTGDGTLDVVAAAQLADQGAVDAGAVYFWEGGASLTGALPPTATFADPTPSANATLGIGIGPRGFQAADVTGDGTLDLVVNAPGADPGGVNDAGALFVWAGGAGLVGTPVPSATLTASGASVSDGMYLLHCTDLTGDGLLDALGGSPGADIAAPNAGALHLFTGGSGLVGSVDRTATLFDPLAVSNDQLGQLWTLCGDVTGDGLLDVVASARLADPGFVVDAGAVYLWSGGVPATPNPNPLAVLAAPNGQTGDGLGD